MGKIKKCSNTRNHVQGCHITCGELVWGPGSERWVCEYCLKKELSELKTKIKTQTWQDQPTEDGYYWLKEPGCKSTMVTVLTCVDKKQRVDLGDDNWLFDPEETTGKWYGPITPPDDN